ncbi:hypothetical protein B0H66DRAFT_526541 [Apodospora peruviana]|uniref:Uncharacterized protein n=1 Tax=Apodospora peruviana TaxID=516989 RepID=A0AAE0MEE3_9PEZI|nr:hypothetical protein B0H66DRAFT_526541 [Apodospora peruviana]
MTQQHGPIFSRFEGSDGKQTIETPWAETNSNNNRIANHKPTTLPPPYADDRQQGHNTGHGDAERNVELPQRFAAFDSANKRKRRRDIIWIVSVCLTIAILGAVLGGVLGTTRARGGSQGNE